MRSTRSTLRTSRNGRWRSKWSLALVKGQAECELTGLIKAQVHYFEDGNVQLVSSKDISETIQIQVGTLDWRDERRSSGCFVRLG